MSRTVTPPAVARADGRSSDPASARDPGLNLVVLRGVVSGPAVLRVLPSGSRLVSLAVRVPAGAGTATSVPVAVWDPAPWVETLGADDEVVVAGAVQRRFYRAGGATGARVEVRAAAIGRAADRRRRASVARRARAALEALD